MPPRSNLKTIQHLAKTTSPKNGKKINSMSSICYAPQKTSLKKEHKFSFAMAGSLISYYSWDMDSPWNTINTTICSSRLMSLRMSSTMLLSRLSWGRSTLRSTRDLKWRGQKYQDKSSLILEPSFGRMKSHYRRYLWSPTYRESIM